MIDVLESKKIASIYVRVSTQEQKKGWSPDVQREYLPSAGSRMRIYSTE
jgi:hypothetical protein